MKRSEYKPTTISLIQYERDWLLVEAKRMGLKDRSKMIRYLIRFYITNRRGK